MDVKKLYIIYHSIGYKNRMMSSIIVAQLFLIAIFRFWPHTPVEDDQPEYTPVRQEVFVEEIINTRQDAAPARPPKPQIPVPVPTDEVIEDDIDFLEFDSELSLDPLGEGVVGQTGDSDQIVGSPDRRPSLLKIVEPTMPDEARRAGIKAEVYVTFLVGRDGTVEDYFVDEIRKYTADGNRFEIVNEIGYGIIAATLEAAAQWKFKPAMDGGEPVKAYTTQVFSFGF